jgi:hypothetical protein
MAAYAWTSGTLTIDSGRTTVREASEALSEGDWVQEVSGATDTIEKCTNADATKANPLGQVMDDVVAGKPAVVALGGCIISATATPAIAEGDWLVLGAAGATNPVGDQASGHEVTMVAEGTAAGKYKININATGSTVP